MIGKPVICGVILFLLTAAIARSQSGLKKSTKHQALNVGMASSPRVASSTPAEISPRQTLTDQQLVTSIDSVKYRSVFWTKASGLSLTKKNAMIRDVHGFLWVISPVGLNRFDGNTFKIFYPDKNSPGSISGTYSFSLVEDSLHNIWIGTNKGLSRYDINADTFTNFSPATLSVNSIATVVPFWATMDLLYCLEKGNTLVTYNTKSLQRTELLVLPPGEPQLTNATVRTSIYHAPSNSIFLLTGDPGKTGGGIMQVFLNDKKIVNHRWSCFHQIKNHAHFSYGMKYDKKRGSIWINSVDGLIEYNVAAGDFRVVPGCDDLMELANYEIMAGMELDKKDNLLYFSQKKGIQVYNTNTGIVNNLYKDPSAQAYVSANNMEIYCDRESMIWLGSLSTAKGMQQLIPFSPSVTRLGNSSSIGADVGAVEYMINILRGGQDTKALPPYQVVHIPFAQQKDLTVLGLNSAGNRAWLYNGQAQSLLNLNLATGVTRPVIVKDLDNEVLDSFNIYGRYTCRFRNGFIFLVDKTGIFYYDDNSDTARQILPIPYHVTNFAVGAEDRIFLRLNFGYTNLCFLETAGEWRRSVTPIDSIEWTSMSYDKINNSYWVGGIKQLHHFDNKFKLLRTFNEDDGVTGVDVLSIETDKNGNVWFNNSDGDISRLNVSANVITGLSQMDGYRRQGFPWLPPHFQDNDSNIYFVGMDGIDKIQPGQVDQFPPGSVYFKSIAVNQMPVKINSPGDPVETLLLTYDQNPLTIATGVINFYTNHQIRIRYRLEGMNQNWQYAAANSLIRFEKLPPGRHRLVVQASSSGNNFNGPEKILLIVVSPPYYQTWWFITATVLVLLAGIYLFARWRLKQKFRLQLQASAKDTQLAELRQKTTKLEMQALRAQMNPHFIFNSLNSINRFILQNDRAQASAYLTKFSKLVRMILQNSQASLITLESELESLRLYLDLEALRFNYHFAYHISFSTELDISALRVPPLIIQPYAENAIWHGLMHKEQKGNLDIEIYEEDGFLFLKIADDGIGRDQSASMHPATDQRHKSMGLKITADRIAILQPGASAERVVRIVDLVAPDGTPAGTEVIIRLPVLYS